MAVKRVKPGARMVQELTFRRCNVSIDAVHYVAKQANVSTQSVNRATVDQELVYADWVKLASWLGVPV